jgi:uncharacterized coiled-coil protein SlyX
MGAIWAAIHWSYKTRLNSLETSLKLVKEDCDIQIKRAIEQMATEHNKQVESLQQKLTTLTNQLNTVKSDFGELVELAEHPELYKNELFQAGREFDKKYFRRASKRSEILLRLESGEKYEEPEPKWIKRKRSEDA